MDNTSSLTNNFSAIPDNFTSEVTYSSDYLQFIKRALGDSWPKPRKSNAENGWTVIPSESRRNKLDSLSEVDSSWNKPNIRSSEIFQLPDIKTNGNAEDEAFFEIKSVTSCVTSHNISEEFPPSRRTVTFGSVEKRTNFKQTWPRKGILKHTSDKLK